jgi:hypothetical protein
MSGIQERREKETEKENEKMPVNMVHVPIVEPQKVEPVEVDTEVHVKPLDLKPVTVTFQKYKPVKIQLNDKVPDLSALLRDKTE